MQRSNYVMYAIFFLLLVLAPLYLDGYYLQLLGRFLALAILAIGISLVWGHGGILPLGQGLFFGLGGYAIAMHLKLAPLTAGEIPDFMQWNGLSALPWFWAPFKSSYISIAAALIVPTTIAAALAWLIFHRRVGGVYFAIITQALALAAATFIVSEQTYSGGFNGLTDFSDAFGFKLFDPHTKIGLYLLTVFILTAVFWAGQWLLKTQFGKLLHAIRDAENRVRFLGYNPSSYKVVVFAIGALLAAVAGILYTLNIGFVSPAMMGVVPSIEMIIWVAIGGRKSLFGAIVGTLMVNFGQDVVSSEFPTLWLYVMGLLYVLVVTLLPNGLSGLLKRVRK